MPNTQMIQLPDGCIIRRPNACTDVIANTQHSSGFTEASDAAFALT
jgi:hypothetical protein